MQKNGLNGFRPKINLHKKYLLIITPKSPHVSCRVDEPREVQAKDVTQDGLRHESHVPSLIPEQDGHDCWDHKAHDNFNWDKESENSKRNCN